MASDNTNDTRPPDSDYEKYVDIKTRDTIREHLSDPNHRITEEDIANVNTDIFKRELSEEEKKEEEEKLKEDLPPKAGSAWDINAG